MSLFLPKIAYADIGPKASIVIDFKGLENENYYVTLLSERNDTGPHRALGVSPNNQRFNEEDEEYRIWEKFVSYNDTDNYYFLQYFQDCTDLSQFKWGYYPPSKFKILIYFPEKESFLISSEIFERYAFDSYYTATIKDFDLQVSEDNKVFLSVKKSYNYTNEIMSLFARIIATIGVEILIALLFRLRKKNILLFIVVVNIVTQSILNILLNIINYKYGGLAFILNYFWMEILIIIIEYMAYTIWFRKVDTQKNIKNWIVLLYAICANVISFGVGMSIANFIPGIF